MKELTENMPLIVFFLILVLFMNMLAGDKMTEAFLWLVLASMVVMNHQKIIDKVEGVFKP